MNSVALVGRLTRDVDMRYTKNGNAVANFSLAVDRQYSRDDEADFVDITVWRKLAENCSKHIGKGRLVAVSGRLQQDRWENDQGQNRSKVKVVADTVQFLDWPGDENGDSTGDDIDIDSVDEDELPF